MADYEVWVYACREPTLCDLVTACVTCFGRTCESYGDQLSWGTVCSRRLRLVFLLFSLGRWADSLTVDSMSTSSWIIHVRRWCQPVQVSGSLHVCRETLDLGFPVAPYWNKYMRRWLIFHKTFFFFFFQPCGLKKMQLSVMTAFKSILSIFHVHVELNYLRYWLGW